MHPNWNQLSTDQQQAIAPLLKWAAPDRVDQFVRLAEAVNSERESKARLAAALKAALDAAEARSVRLTEKRSIEPVGLSRVDEGDQQNGRPGIGE